MFSQIQQGQGGVDLSKYEKTISAGEILEKILNSEHIAYNHVIIIGNLNLNILKNNLINSSIEINDSLFEGSVQFRDGVFLKSINFSGSEFEGYTNFRGTNFNGYATFTKSKFNNYTTFGDAIFSKDAYFNSANFSEGANFAGAHFERYANFNNVLFSKDVNFILSKFDKASFYESSFLGLADFRGIEINFGNFDISIFWRDVSLNVAKINELITFNKANFNGNLIFEKTRINGLDVPWNSIKNNFISDEYSYLSLIESYKKRGKFEEADACYFSYRDWKEGSKSWLEESKYIDIVSKYSCGYGIKWKQTILFGLFCLLLFSIPYYIGYHQAGTFSLGFWQVLRVSLAFSAMALFSMPRELYPYGRKKFEKLISMSIIGVPCRLIFAIERLIGWGLLILFINTLSRVMIRY